MVVGSAIETIMSDFFPDRKYEINQKKDILYVSLVTLENFNNMEKYMNDIKFVIFESKNKKDIDKLLDVNVNKYKSKNIITYIILLVLILLIIYVLIKHVIN